MGARGLGHKDVPSLSVPSLATVISCSVCLVAFTGLLRDMGPVLTVVLDRDSTVAFGYLLTGLSNGDCSFVVGEIWNTSHGSVHSAGPASTKTNRDLHVSFDPSTAASRKRQQEDHSMVWTKLIYREGRKRTRTENCIGARCGSWEKVTGCGGGGSVRR